MSQVSQRDPQSSVTLVITPGSLFPEDRERLRHRREGGHYLYELPAEGNLEELLVRHEIRLRLPVSPIINGRAADWQQTLKPGDEVKLLPQIAGG